MIKKIYFIFFLLIITVSCGKKGDPEYNGQKSEVTNTKLLMLS